MNKYVNKLQNFLFAGNEGITSKITFYSHYDKLFLFSNELLKECPKEDLADKNVLTLTASGDHIISNIFQGANNITAFDINTFARYYAALKLAMIKTYDYNKFVNLLYTSYVTSNNLFENGKVFSSILSDVKKHLTQDEILFWETYINICSNHYGLLINNLFFGVNGNYNINNNLYSDYGYYKELKSRL